MTLRCVTDGLKDSQLTDEQLCLASAGYGFWWISEAVIVSSEHTNGDHRLKTSHELE